MNRGDATREGATENTHGDTQEHQENQVLGEGGDTHEAQGLNPGNEEREGQQEERTLSPRERMVAEIAEKNRQARESQGSGDEGGDAGASHADGDGGNYYAGGQEEMVTIKVDGQERTVPLSQVIDYGKRAFQKETAGDERLRQAAQAQRQLEARAQDLARREAEIQALAQKAEREYHGNKDPSAQEKADAPDFDALAREAASMVYEGDEEKLTEALKKLFEGRAQAAIPGSNQMVDMASQQNPPMTREDLEWFYQEREIEREKSKAIRWFQRNYPHLAGDEGLYKLADHETIKVYEENPTWEISEIVEEAARRIDERYGSGRQDSRAQKQERKRNMPSPVQAATARSTPPQDGRPKTRSEVINETRRARGQPVL